MCWGIILLSWGFSFVGWFGFVVVCFGFFCGGVVFKSCISKELRTLRYSLQEQKKKIVS